MSYGALIQKAVHATFETKKRKELVLANLCNQSFSGDVKDGGESVKIIEEANVTKISSLGLKSGPLTYEDLSPSAQEMRIEYDPAFNIRLGDREKDQIKSGDAKKVLNNAIDLGMYILRDDVDSRIGGCYTDAGLLYTDSVVTITKSNAYEYLNTMRTVFKKANLGVYEKDFCAALPYDWTGMLELDESNQYTEKGMDIRMNGWKGKCAGWNIFESNNLTTDASGNTWPLFMIKGQSIALAMQKEPTYKDSTRPNYFEESHAYRIVYGVKGYNPGKLGTLPVKF